MTPAVSNGSDPWAVTGSDAGHRIEPAARGIWLRAAAVGVLAAGGPVWRLLDAYQHGRNLAAATLFFASTGIALGIAARIQGHRWWLTPAAVGVLVALVGNVPTFGRSPLAMTLVGAGVCEAILGDWGRRRTGGTAVLAVAPVVLAEVHWGRGGTLAATIALFAAGLVLLVAYLAAPRAMRAVDRTFSKVLVGAVEVIGVVAVGLVALPTLYLWGALALLLQSTRRLVGKPPQSTWQRIDSREADIERDAGHAFATTARPIRRRRR